MCWYVVCKYCLIRWASIKSTSFNGEIEHKLEFQSSVIKMVENVAFLLLLRQVFERIILSVKSLILQYTPDFKITNFDLFQLIS